jgi:hypothetical protein
MAAVRSVSFAGRTKRILAPVTATTSTTAQAVVPRGARRGKIRVRDSYRQVSELSEQKLLIRPRSQLRTSGSLQLVAPWAPTTSESTSSRRPVRS